MPLGKPSGVDPEKMNLTAGHRARTSVPEWCSYLVTITCNPKETSQNACRGDYALVAARNSGDYRIGQHSQSSKSPIAKYYGRS